MDRIKTTEGDVIVRDARFAIVASRFNDFIVDSLIKASLHCLRQHGANDSDIEIIRVPGAFEMPIAVDKVAAYPCGQDVAWGVQSLWGVLLRQRSIVVAGLLETGRSSGASAFSSLASPSQDGGRPGELEPETGHRGLVEKAGHASKSCSSCVSGVCKL